MTEGRRERQALSTSSRRAIPSQRELAQFNLLPDLIRHAMAKAPGWAAAARGRRSGGRHLARGAGEAAGAAQVGAEGPAGQAARPSAASPPSPAGALGAHLHVARADLRARGLRRGLVAHGARAVRRRHPQGRHRAQHLRLSPDARRLDPGCRRARARLRRHRRRPRQHRAAARGHPAPEAHRLRRRAGLPEDPARQGQGGRQGRVVASRRRWSAAARCSPRCGPSTRSAASPPTRPTPRPTSASSPTRARRSRA